MSMFTTAEEHAANPPETWQAVKACERVWHLRTAGGVTLDTFKTRREAEDARASGHWPKFYERLSRWYAGITPPGWKTYAQVCAERERNEARQRQREQFRAAGYAVCPVMSPDKRCSGGREPIPAGTVAWEDRDGWLWCRDHLAALLSEETAGQ